MSLRLPICQCLIYRNSPSRPPPEKWISPLACGESSLSRASRLINSNSFPRLLKKPALTLPFNAKRGGEERGSEMSGMILLCPRRSGHWKWVVNHHVLLLPDPTCSSLRSSNRSWFNLAAQALPPAWHVSCLQFSVATLFLRCTGTPISHLPLQSLCVYIFFEKV